MKVAITFDCELQIRKCVILTVVAGGRGEKNGGGKEQKKDPKFGITIENA